MTAYTLKTIDELIKGDIILHPIFRPDGLLLVSRYKVLEGSILLHVKKQVPGTIKVLTIRTKDALNELLNEWIVNKEEYKNLIEQISLEHQTYITIHLDHDCFWDSEIIREISNKGDRVTGVLSSPLWSQINTIVDSISIRQRIKTIIPKLQTIIETDPSIYQLYNKMADYHDVLKIHSVNTACLSFIIGLTIELSDEEMIDLTLATLFADIGYIRYPKDEFIELLKGYSSPSSKVMLAKHIKYSVAEISTSDSCRKKSIIYGVYDHHEDFDGNGVPNRKKGMEIHLFGRIIAIAQHYDLLVGGYTDQGSYSNLEAHRMVWDQTGIKFDPKIIQTFIHRTSLFKVGKDILLPNFQKGSIIGFSDYINHPLSPIVKFQDGSIVNLTINR